MKMNHARLIKITIILSVIIFYNLLLFPGSVKYLARAASSEWSRPGSFAELVKKASPSVVNISSEKVIENKGMGQMPFGDQFGEDDPFREFFKHFFGDQIPKKFKQRGLGSGFIIDSNGLILTNNHVVANAEKIEVTLNDNDNDYEAKIIGRDPKTDLALIKIETNKPLTPLPLGDSEKLNVGDWVIAIGSPFGLGHTVTAGIVSAKYRRIGIGAYDDFIQTDASINPGNSGGPLLNVNGEVVGINTAIFSQGGGGNVGIGFAIPINMAKDLLPQLKKGKVIRGWLGVVVQAITPELKDKLDLKDEKGALVSDVTEDSPADKAGLKRGDVIISFDGQKIEEIHDLPYLVATTPVGKRVRIEIIRNGKEEDLEAVITESRQEPTTSSQTPEKGTGPDLGMTLRENTPEFAKNHNLSENHGLVVLGLTPNGPAFNAGLQVGDIILELDRVPINSLEAFKKKVKEYKSGDTLLFLILRQTNTMYLALKIPER